MTIRRSAVLVTVATLIPLLFSGAGMSAPPSWAGGEFVPDEVLVKFEPGVSPGVVARAVGARIAGRIPTLDVFILKVPEGTVEATVLALTNNTLVEYAEPNGIATVDLDPNDMYEGSCYNSSKHGCVAQWAWGRVSAYAAWDLTTGSTGIRVAVVDTGIANSHPDLPPVVAQRDFVNNDNNAEDDNGHGTHVAGTIGARTDNVTGVAGANWTVSLLAAKVLSRTGSGSYSAVASGIIWAADNDADAINLSLGGTAPSTTLKNAVNYAWNKGAVLACAAGNSGISQKSYPAAYDRCIAVAATDESDVKASFSNYGSSWVDVAAPGVRILSTMPTTSVYLNTQYGYSQNYDSLNGTSMATPHVAGLAALIRAKGACGINNNTCVRNRIEGKADRISGTGTYWQWGRVNYYNAVR